MIPLVIYSALYGGYEEPKVQPDLGVPLVIYTDDPHLVAPGWEVRHEPLHNVAGSMMRSRLWKCRPDLAVAEAEVTIWIDASMTVTRPDMAGELRSRLGGQDALFMRHPWRDCIYDEVVAAAVAPKYRSQPMTAQVAEYRRHGHPTHGGLIACGMMVRRNNDQTRDLGDEWFQEQQRWSYMDQLSLPYLLRYSPLSWGWIEDPWEHWWTTGSHPSYQVP